MPSKKGTVRNPAVKRPVASRTPQRSGTLPRYFSRLGLDEAQRRQVLATQAKFDARQEKLAAQRVALEKERKAALEAVLSRAQRQELKSLQSTSATRRSGVAKRRKDQT